MDILLGKIEGRSRKGQQKMRWLNSITYSMDMNLSKLWEIVKDREPGVLQSMGSQRVRHDLATEQKQFCISKGGISNQWKKDAFFNRLGKTS